MLHWSIGCSGSRYRGDILSQMEGGTLTPWKILVLFHGSKRFRAGYLLNGCVFPYKLECMSLMFHLNLPSLSQAHMCVVSIASHFVHGVPTPVAIVTCSHTFSASTVFSTQLVLCSQEDIKDPRVCFSGLSIVIVNQ